MKVNEVLLWLNACQPGAPVYCVVDNNNVYLVAKRRDNAGLTEMKIGEICHRQPVA